MEQLKMFDLPEPDKQVKVKSGDRCKKCRHIYSHLYGKMLYCSKQKGRRTAYGHKKIKANDFACNMFENL